MKLVYIKLLKQLLLLSVSLLLGMSYALDINSASAAEISSQFKGIGEVKAQAIIKYREENGPFTGPNDLLKVKGIGEKTLETMSKNLEFGKVDELVKTPKEMPAIETKGIKETKQPTKATKK